jgi:hypothetical protein
VHRNDGEAVTEGGFVMIPMGLCVLSCFCVFFARLLFSYFCFTLANAAAAWDSRIWAFLGLIVFIVG